MATAARLGPLQPDRAPRLPSGSFRLPGLCDGGAEIRREILGFRNNLAGRHGMISESRL
jgi:hypothetical protein